MDNLYTTKFSRKQNVQFYIRENNAIQKNFCFPRLFFFYNGAGVLFLRP